MLKENISLSQLFTLIINFLIGSAIVIGVGKDAKQDAWIAVFLATLVGLVIMYTYYYMMSLLPGKNLFEIFEYCFKRPIAIFLSFVYILYFLYISARVTKDFVELIMTAVLPSTPMEFISITLCLLMAYVLYLGLEVLGRVSEIFTPYVIGFVLLLLILLLASGHWEIKNIQPILGDGVKPIAKSLFPALITFPFGELIIFTIILSSVTDFKYSKLITLSGVAIAGMLLVITMFLMIISLGVDLMERSNFPLLSASRLVKIGEFLERIDAIVVFIMMLGIIIKVSIFAYGGLKGLEYIFKIPFRYFSLPIMIAVSIFSNLISFNFADHIEEGIKIVPKYLHIPLDFIIPILTILLLIWKRKRDKHSSENGVKC